MIRIQEEILKSVRAVPTVLRTLVRGVDDERLRWRPTDGEWAIIEVIAHMADTDERALARIQRMLAEEEPYLEAFDQEQLARDRGYIDFELATEIDRLQSTLGALEALLTTLKEAGWRRTGRHEEHGVMSVDLYMSHVAAEDIDHLAQIAHLVDTPH